MERMLQQKEQHLEGQQAKLAAWAAELQRREAALAEQQARLAGRPGEAAPPAPAAAPTSAECSPAPGAASPGLGSVMAAGLAAMQQRRAQQQASPAAGGGSGPGTAPDSPAAPGEWTEEFEPGVLLSFATEGGARKLRRIRFSRSLFSAESAKQVRHC